MVARVTGVLRAVASFGAFICLSVKAEVLMALNMDVSLMVGAALLGRHGATLRSQKRLSVQEPLTQLQEQGLGVRLPYSPHF